MTPRRKLDTYTSIIGKSPNCRISTLNDKTPKSKMLTLSGSGVRKKYANEKTPPRKLTKPPEVRVKSASSTPKKNRYSGRLYEPSTIERNKNEKLRTLLANDRRRDAPKISDRIIRDREKKIVEYSPDTVTRQKPGENYGVKNIAVRLDERMYDENPENDCDFRPMRDADDPRRELRVHNDTKIEPEQDHGNTAFTDDQGTTKFPDTENDEEQKYGASFESPRSSLTRQNNSSLNCTANDEEAKLLLEIEEALEKRCGTPPASVSMLEVDENLEKEAKIFHSDYSSDESSSFCELHEADPGTMSLCLSEGMDQASLDDFGIDNFGDSSLSEDRDENLPAPEEVPVSPLSKELLKLHWTTSEREAYRRSLEEKAFKKYSVAKPEGHFRDGLKKTSFCYLLLDPRVTKDLPRRGVDLPVEKRWRIFLEGVFYVGKGMGERPFGHLKETPENSTKKKSGQKGDKEKRKRRRICDIGKDGLGVVCLVVFSWVMSEEAHIREACMIKAFNSSNKSHLTNIRLGTFYGAAKAMSDDEKCFLGRYLLYKSMEIFMLEGERQLPL